ncbi:unnamed protein product, partial [Scytosiphon promiscuus]
YPSEPRIPNVTLRNAWRACQAHSEWPSMVAGAPYSRHGSGAKERQLYGSNGRTRGRL